MLTLCIVQDIITAMQKNNRKRDPIPNEFASVEEAVEFWDTHDLTDYEDNWRQVDFKVNLKRSRSLQVQLESKVATQVAKRARARRMPIDKFVNRLLKDYFKRAA